MKCPNCGHVIESSESYESSEWYESLEINDPPLRVAELWRVSTGIPVDIAEIKALAVAEKTPDPKNRWRRFKRYCLEWKRQSGGTTIHDQPGLKKYTKLVKVDVSDSLTWEKCLKLIEGRVTRPSFKTWFSATVGLGWQGRTYFVMAPNAYAADLIMARCYTIMADVLKEIAPKSIGIEIRANTE